MTKHIAVPREMAEKLYASRGYDVIDVERAIIDGPGVEPVDVSTPFLRSLLERLAPEVDPDVDLTKWPEALAFQIELTRAVIKELNIAAPSAPVQAVPDWQPIETAPKDGTEILAADSEVEGGFMQVVAYDALYSAPWRTQEDYGYSEHAFTHWMPRPQPPKESTAQSVACPTDKEK